MLKQLTTCPYGLQRFSSILDPLAKEWVGEQKKLIQCTIYEIFRDYRNISARKVASLL